ncbi:hypothetical protein FJTKL_01027 [Diaporthe vaccinii]|uniref:DNA2/NAM7 helicase-like C-terminal domain-containing protein n=1 Tax=Diaporthe vaccinii TaxID=105482 RepID=A0ABR4E1F5_9PEZI
MLCGLGTRKFAFDTDHQIVPPYPSKEVDLLALTGAPAEDVLTAKIISNTIGKLGAYSESVQSIIRALPDGILGIEAFPGAGKTTVAAAIDACLCLLSGDFKITVVAGQHAALDALNGNLHQQLTLSVTTLNREMGQNHSEPVVQLPLVLLASGNENTEINELLRIVKSEYESGPNAGRPNTLCELWLQLLDAGPHHLPTFSKSGLTELAAAVKSQESEGFQRLRRFVAGELTWDEANQTPEHLNLQDGQQKGEPRKDVKRAPSDKKLMSKTTAKDALKEIKSHITPLVNILICTTATAATAAYSNFVEEADLCQNEEAGATCCPQIFTGWRGISQPLIVSGDGAQFGPYMHSHVRHKFQNYLAISTLDMIKSGGYPVFQLRTQHRAIDGQFDPVYENFYGDFKSIRSPASQHPGNHPDAQRVEAAFVAGFAGLQPSPEGRIVPMFIHVPETDCKHDRTLRHRPGIKTSKYNPAQARVAAHIVKKLMGCNIKAADIMVIGAYRAETTRLRDMIPDDVLVTTADAVQGQERRYVVFVFSTTRKTGPGFTRDPKRLCVSMTRQKEFLALVGDIETVQYPSGSNDTRDLASIHNYFIRHRRVGNLESRQERTQDAPEVPEPSTTDVRDEQRERLQAQVDAAIAALREYDASIAQSSTDSGQIQNEEDAGFDEMESTPGGW